MKKFEKIERTSGKLPLILKLDVAGQPSKWIHWQDAVIASCTGKVIWTAGNAIQIAGGTNSRTGKNSVFELYPIISVNEKPTNRKIALTNKSLFRRDGFLCMYCGHEFPAAKLTRDHVMPSSRGGRDSFQNTVAACRGCNHFKGARTPEEAGMKLLAVPYEPSAAESLILQNRKVTADQQAFLHAQIPKDSRYWKTRN